MVTWRFDDVSINTDLEQLNCLIEIIRRHEVTKILLAVSPIVFSVDQLLPGHEQRVHPTILTAMSALYPYYKGTRCGIPDLPQKPYIIRAAHGLAHVDHRLLDYQAQEMSIVMSCSLVGATTFVPPYNHWDENTQAICDKHGFKLIRFEDGWRHALHNPFEISAWNWYCHPYDFATDQLKAWFQR